eukprot:4577084-Amphidinium_carterae.1
MVGTPYGCQRTVGKEDGETVCSAGMVVAVPAFTQLESLKQTCGMPALSSYHTRKKSSPSCKDSIITIKNLVHGHSHSWDDFVLLLREIGPNISQFIFCQNAPVFSSNPSISSGTFQANDVSPNRCSGPTPYVPVWLMWILYISKTNLMIGSWLTMYVMLA